MTGTRRGGLVRLGGAVCFAVFAALEWFVPSLSTPNRNEIAGIAAVASIVWAYTAIVALRRSATDR